MGWFVKDFFATSPMLAFPIVALLIFVGVFVALTVRVMRLPRADVDAMARLAVDSREERTDG